MNEGMFRIHFNPGSGAHRTNIFQNFNRSLSMATATGKVDSITASNHIKTLNTMLSEKRHEDAQKYVVERSEELGFPLPPPPLVPWGGKEVHWSK